MVAAVDQGKHMGMTNVAAGTHTAPADDAQIHVTVEEGVVLVDRQVAVGDRVGTP